MPAHPTAAAPDAGPELDAAADVADTGNETASRRAGTFASNASNVATPDASTMDCPTIEAWCLQWLRMDSVAGAAKFGNWWGNAVDEFRRTKQRSSEEIDAVGSLRIDVAVVAVVAEAKWTTTPLTTAIVDDLDTYKIPALR